MSKVEKNRQNRTTLCKAQIVKNCKKLTLIIPIFFLLTACSTPQKSSVIPADSVAKKTVKNTPSSTQSPSLVETPKSNTNTGAYYKDDGPGDMPPSNVDSSGDAIPKIEPYSSSGNKPYTVLGKTYVPMTEEKPFSQRGNASWYGKKFHGQRTASGEIYDMYKMTAAHPTLPIPCYIRVKNVSNGREVIVKVNDRGPFHTSRILDLSYAAALKLGYINKGSAEVAIERILPSEIAKLNQNKSN